MKTETTNSRTFTQKGIWLITVFSLLSIFFIILILRNLPQEPTLAIIYSISALLSIICLLFLYQLKIVVTDRSIKMEMGIGLFKREYPFENLISVKPVKNSIWMGLGFRKIYNGWLYNISGTQAIELRFKDSSKVIRIGTDRPVEVSMYIESVMFGKTPPQYSHIEDYSSKNKNWIYALIIIVSMAIVFAIAITPNIRDTRAYVEDENLIIQGSYGMTISLNDITQVDTVDRLPSTSMRTNGYAAGKTLIGNFKLSTGGKVKLFVKKKNPPYLRIQIKGKPDIYLNFEEKEKTRKLAEELM